MHYPYFGYTYAMNN